MAERAAGSAHRRRGERTLPAVTTLAVGLFIALLAFGLATNAPDDDIDAQLAIAQAPVAPAFELAVLHGGSPGRRLDARVSAAVANGRVALAELRGVPIVLNFWASWCIPCREEAPLLERTWQTARSDGILFLGLNMQDLTDDAREFMREFRMSFPNVRDPSNRVARSWGVTGLPETFFLTSDGKIVGHVIGVVSPDQLRTGIAAARTGRPSEALEGGDRRATR